MRILDLDNSGTISLDEFLNFFSMVKSAEKSDISADVHELQENLWPVWLQKEGILEKAQNLFANM